METRDEIFDDANGDLAIGELESAVEKYQRCVELGALILGGRLQSCRAKQESTRGKPRSAALFVGWTPSSCTKVKRC